MRTNRIALAGVLALALAVVPAAVAAQATDEELSTPSYWTAVETPGPSYGIPGVKMELFPWGSRDTVGFEATAEADDPRASGDITVVFTYDLSARGNLGRGIGLVRLVNEGGSFEGPIHVVYYPDGSEFRMVMMEGKGGYEGLTYTMTNYVDPSGIGQPQGLIWEGEMPPLPDTELLPD